MARNFLIFPHTDDINMVAVEDCDKPMMYITNNTFEPSIISVPVPKQFPKQIIQFFKDGIIPSVS